MEKKSQDTLINILWDASPLWGHLVLNAVIQTGLSYQVIKASDCQAGKIKGKILIVPGGSGRFKAQILGEEGKLAIQKFVSDGGIYLGFCGGAGLALTDANGGLGLCPWGRNFYKDRTQHLISGNIVSEMAKNKLVPQDYWESETELPVWWPGRIAEPEGAINHNELQGQVDVLVRYVDMGKDLYLSDLPIDKLPATALEDWKNLYGIDLRPNLLNRQPCIIAGDYGKGQYFLSYSHLETPDAKEANLFLGHILKEYLDPKSLENMDLVHDSIQHFEVSGKSRNTNVFNKQEFNLTWLMPQNNPEFALLAELYQKLEEVFSLAVDLHLLFPRKTWLYGWHSSIPGSQLNALRVALMRSLHLPSTAKRKEFLNSQGSTLQKEFDLFTVGAKNWLLAKKLSLTLADAELVSDEIIQSQKKELFGLHMLGGGLCGAMITLFDDFLFME